MRWCWGGHPLVLETLSCCVHTLVLELVALDLGTGHALILEVNGHLSWE